jgi:hypothetical protein
VLGLVLGAATVGFLAGGLAGALDISLPGSAGPASTPAPTGTGDATPTPSPGGPSLTLTSDTESVPQNGDIRLSGALTPATGGVRLQVERRIDGGDWGDFPVTTTTRDDGSYSTVVRSGRVGANDFRMAGEVDGERVESPTVTVQIS